MQFCTFNIYTLHASLSASLVPSTNMPLGEEILSFGQNLERKKGTNEAWEIQLIGWRGEMLRLYIWLRLHWGKYIEDKSWLCSSSIGELWRRVVPGSMVRYSPRCCACVNASTSFPGRNRSCSEFVTTAPVHHNALQHECPYTVYNKHSSGCPSLSAVAIIT